MKIAIVADWLTNQGGAENVVLDLMEAFPQADLYTSIYNAAKLPQFAKYNPKTSFVNKLPFAQKKHQLYLALMPYAFESFDLREYDVVISSSFACSKGIITKPETLHISYCHTPMRYVWGAYIDFISRYKLPKILKAMAKPLLHKIRIWDFVASQRVDKFIANSNYIKTRIQKFYRADSIVLNPGIEEPITDLEPIESLADKPFYLAIGRLTSHKRFDLIIEAFNRTKQTLVIAGDGDILSDLMSLNTNPNTHFVGFVSKQQRAWLYSKAQALIFPQKEDFGIVPIEAQSYGCSIIAYNKGGILDSVQNGVQGVLFDIQSVDCLVDAIAKHSEIKFDKKQIKQHASKFYRSEFQNKIKEIVTSAYDAHKQIYS